MATETTSAEPRLWRPLLLWVAPAVLIAVAGAFWFFGRGYASTDNAYVKADRTTVAAEVDGTVRSVPLPASITFNISKPYHKYQSS